MKKYTLTNDKLNISVNSFGAELSSIKDSDNKEYLWNADEKFWKRSSPVLFPIVGSLNGKHYLYNGKEYPMSQHGFARDMDFTLLSQTDDSIFFQLKSNDETYEKYPFKFNLEVGYKLVDNKISVIWKLKNTDNKEMFFSIGAHPAFMCPVNSTEKQSDCSISFGNIKSFDFYRINSDGLKTNEKHTIPLENGILKITDNLFDDGVFIVEDNQTNVVSLLDKNKNPFVKVKFDTEIFGIWSPEKKNAPFICIEPWYGRCDSEDFHGELSEREYGCSLKPQQTFETSYTIEIG